MGSDASRPSLSMVRRAVMEREWTAENVCREHLERISSTDDRIQAFLTVTAERALEKARRVDAQVARGADPGMLAGVPIAVKDIFSTRGIRTTCGSRILETYIPPYTATAVERLEAAGAVLVGKTNMDEFAMGSSTENSAYFPTRNPWDLARVPGGSSGGSAAAVAAGQVVAAIGSDTGGSVRQPAAFCGVVGLKPTYGRISRHGLIAFASSLDHVGIFARSAGDCATVLQAIAGPDSRDSTCSPLPVDDDSADDPAAPCRVAMLPDSIVEKLDTPVREVYAENLGLIGQMGAEVRHVELPHWDLALPAYYILAPCEASANLARYDGVRFGLRSETYSDLRDMYCRTRDRGFGAEVKRRIILGTHALSSGYYDAYYRRACRVRTLILRDLDECFRQFDFLVMPTTPGPAFPLGERTQDPIRMYLSDVFTVAANLAGVPAVSVPAGRVDGLPVGLQIIGPHFSERKILNFARRFEGMVALPVDSPPIVVGHG